MKSAIIRRKGIGIDVSRDGKHPLPMAEYRPLLAGLRFRQVTHLYGADVIVATDPDTGEKTITRVLTETKRLYCFDDHGRLFCGAGYLDRLYTELTRAGYNVGYVDLTPDRPDVFIPRWDRLARLPEFTPQPGDPAALAQALAAGRLPDVSLARRVKQDEIIRAVARRIDLRDGGIVQAPAGLGKSMLLAAFPILYPKAKIAVVVPGQDNVFKTSRHLTRFLPNITIQGCGKTARTADRVVVYSLDSAHHIPQDVDLILCDEVHKAGAPEAAGTLNHVALSALRIGLTATPTGRGDGSDARLEGLFGPVFYRMTWPEAVALGLVVNIEVRWLAANFPANPAAGLTNPSTRKKRGIWNHDARNALFAAAVRKHPDDQVLMLVETIEHALVLQRLLPEFTLVYGAQDLDYFKKWRRAALIAADFAPVSPAQREAMRQDFERGALRKVIATDVWSTGVSFDALAVLARLDARASTILNEQIPGRTSRVHTASGKAVGILYDSDDFFDPGFRATGFRRRADYKEKGWAQKDLGRADNLAR
jgi:superfamily II DNA or RNA helicase